MKLNLEIIGVLLVLLATIHIIFPKYFNWRQELNSLQLINKQMMYVHTFFIALIVLLMGILCLSSATELLSTALGKKISLGLAIFWGIRLCCQFFGYSPALWKGKKFETTIHVLFTGLWIYFSFIFFKIFFSE